MDSERIRQLLRADVFQAFTLVLKDGRRRRVGRSCALGMSSNGRFILYTGPAGEFERFATEAVEEVIVEPPLSDQASINVERVRSLRNAEPFRAFDLVVDDGRTLRVDQPYRLAIAPHGRELTYAGPPLGYERIAAARIVEVLAGN